MKKQSLIIGAAIAATLTSSMAFAIDANIGVTSAYYFRGVQQVNSASANGGVDYDLGNGISVGVWAADVGNSTEGIEYDLYGSYGGSAGGFDYSVGYTFYLYTGDFDTEYGELNLGTAVGPVAIDVAIGTHEAGATDDDYSFISVSGDIGPVAVTIGSWGGDFSGEYLELGIGTDIGGADAGISLITSDSDNVGVTPDLTTDGTSLVFSISKSFSL